MLRPWIKPRVIARAIGRAGFISHPIVTRPAVSNHTLRRLTTTSGDCHIISLKLNASVANCTFRRLARFLAKASD